MPLGKTGSPLKAPRVRASVSYLGTLQHVAGKKTTCGHFRLYKIHFPIFKLHVVYLPHRLPLLMKIKDYENETETNQLYFGLSDAASLLTSGE